MKVTRNNRGAVSVFLIIILVPCLLVSSIFVDLGRVHMAKAMGESAADLALNSLLTNYDADLKDWYGMIASCQNIDEFYEVSAEFFLRTISSQGMSDDEIYLLSDYYAQATNDDTIYDLLKIEPKTETNKIVSAVENANLSNPTLIKDSIIEFMKYRAPIEITTNLIERLQDSNGAGSGMDEFLQADENEPLVVAKQDFYEAEGDLYSAAFKSYTAIMTYYNNAKNMNLSNNKLVEYTTKLDSYKAIYGKIHEILVKNLLNTEGLSKYTHVCIPLDKYQYDKTSSEIYSEHVTEENASKEKVEHYYIDGSKIETLLTDLDKAITNFETARDNLVNAGASLMANQPGEGMEQAYVVQWWVQMNQAVNATSGTNYTEAVNTKADKMIKAYAKVLAISECEPRNAASDWETRATSLKDKVTEYHTSYLDNSVLESDDYASIVKKLEEVSSNFLTKISYTYYTVNVNGSVMSLDSALAYIASDLKNLKEDLEDRIDELKIAIDGKFHIKKSKRIESLDKLKALAKEYASDFELYSGEANSSTTTMGEDERTDELPKLQLETEINENSVSELKTRLVNIKNQLQKIVDGIDSMKYANKAVTSINTFSIFKNLAKGKGVGKDIPLNNGAILTHSTTTFNNLYAPATEHIITLTNTNNNAYNPDINPAEGNTVACPKLLVYFHKQWNGKSNEKFDAASEDEENAKDEQADYENKEKEAAKKYRGGGHNPVKEFSGESDYKATALLGSVVGLFKDLMDGNYDHIRDDLYATTYVMDMFSYATFDREGQYSLIEDEKQKELTLKNFSTTYDSDTIQGNKDTEKTWLSENAKDSYNKTLTNVMINQDNNASYLAEVEYILYGKATNQENLNEAFEDIYALRYALNLVSCFRNYWGDKTIGGISGVISSTFSGVIPVSVIKAVLLALMTAVETCTDLRRLSAGFPVEIYKTSTEDWWLDLNPTDSNYSSFFKSLSSEGILNKKNKDKGFYYGDYLMLFIYTGFSGNTEGLEADMYRRIAEVIQLNINKKLGTMDKKDNYSLKKSVTYFKLNCQIRVEPLMITLPVFSEYTNGMKTTTDWCTFDVATVRGYS